MPAFDTPQPILAEVDVVTAEVRIRASERATTSVDVVPTDPSNPEDVKFAEQTRVEYADGRLTVRTPKLRSWATRSAGSIDVTIELPAASELRAAGQLAGFDCDGPLGDCRIKTGIGPIRLDRAASVTLKSGAGDIEVGAVSGHAEITSGSGDIRVRELDGGAVIKNSNGDAWVGSAAGDLRLHAANGNLAVDRAEATLVAKSSNGDVRLGEAAGSSVTLETKLGSVEVGIPEGTAAWLDVKSTAGRVRNGLDSSGAPDPSAPIVEVRARTSIGDIVIRRPR